MKKQAILDLIVSQANEDDQFAKSLMMAGIIELIRKSNDSIPDPIELKKKFKAGLFVVEQIKFLDDSMDKCESIECIKAAQHQKRKYLEQLKKITNEL